MKTDINQQPLNERIHHLETVVSSQRFLTKQGLGNEVPFFICPFNPNETVEMERQLKQLIIRLGQKSIQVLEINLYDLAIELLKARGIWDRILDMEMTIPKEQLQELLQGVLDPEAHIVPAIAKKLETTDFHVLFISGVGEVFPYIRSHNVLNNLQSIAKEKPTVMFFPGAYTQSPDTGASLDLFEKFHDDKYYRAFNIFHFEV